MQRRGFEMHVGSLKSLAISLIVLVVAIQYIVSVIRPWLPYIIAACVLMAIGWLIYSKLKRF
jgi:hypothetical protein